MLTLEQLQMAASVAAEAAREAGEFIASRRPDVVEHKAGGSSLASQVVTDVDRAAEALIVARLGQFQTALPASRVGLLTEETPDDGSRLDSDCFWCIDPLDGTLAYTRGDAGYAVSIALVSQAGKPLVGVVYDPVREVLHRAVRGGQMSRTGPAPSASSDRSRRLRVCFDRSMADVDGYEGVLSVLEAAAGDIGLEGLDLTLGAAGAVLNACHVLDESPGCYFKFPKAEPGGGSLWDFAATACLFEVAGASVSDMAGQPLQLNGRGTTFMHRRGVMMASSEVLAKDILGRLERLVPELVRCN